MRVLVLVWLAILVIVLAFLASGCGEVTAYRVRTLEGRSACLAAGWSLRTFETLDWCVRPAEQTDTDTE